ncbi:DUF4290 domain-containing protein [Dysgonomonas macrotermitis]|uniref:DUF4290 domain-containing protein n=1 Tax=Dysgonomonas macrotermitis TaxID=1346286 RepID=A0A1M5AIH7_9BACT|nr:DUF4290 domain-containing protein [Dysgonomonas macrotermitis]SHF30078.1 protein of unknown function [Dysgonomonas macrotermitis]
MNYNTQLKKLALPEYGRNIQNMVDFCLTIPGKDERKRCANSIINIMGNLFPHLRDVNDFKHILWDHLAIMADFKLDIDYPYDIIKKENLYSKPGKVPYSRPTMHFKHYGKTLEKLIGIASDYPEGKERDQLIWLVLNHMKKTYIQWNKDVDDAKLFVDLYELSNRKIDKRDSDMKLADMKDLNQRKPQQQRNNKKK